MPVPIGSDAIISPRVLEVAVTRGLSYVFRFLQ